VDLGAIEVAGEILLEARRADGAGRVGVDDLLAVQPAVEAADRGEGARHRTLAEPPSREVGEEAAHREPVDPLPAPPTRSIMPPEKADELAEVAAVRADGVRRDVALLGEMGEVVVDVGGDGGRGTGVSRGRARPRPAVPRPPSPAVHAPTATRPFASR